LEIWATGIAKRNAPWPTAGWLKHLQKNDADAVLSPRRCIYGLLALAAEFAATQQQLEQLRKAADAMTCPQGHFGWSHDTSTQALARYLSEHLGLVARVNALAARTTTDLVARPQARLPSTPHEQLLGRVVEGGPPDAAFERVLRAVARLADVDAFESAPVGELLRSCFAADTYAVWAKDAQAAKSSRVRPSLARLFAQALNELRTEGRLKGYQAPTAKTAHLLYLFAYACTDRVLRFHSAARAEAAAERTAAPRVPDHANHVQRDLHVSHAVEVALYVRRGVDGLPEAANVVHEREPASLGVDDLGSVVRRAVNAVATRDTSLDAPWHERHGAGGREGAERLSDAVLVESIASFEQRTGTPLVALFKEPKQGDEALAATQIRAELAALGVRSCDVFVADPNMPEWNEVRSWFQGVLPGILDSIDSLTRSPDAAERGPN
jgi:hypothetical protein